AIHRAIQPVAKPMHGFWGRQSGAMEILQREPAHLKCLWIRVVVNRLKFARKGLSVVVNVTGPDRQEAVFPRDRSRRFHVHRYEDFATAHEIRGSIGTSGGRG